VGGGYASGILQEWHIFHWLALMGVKGAQGGEDWDWVAELCPEFFGVGIIAGPVPSFSIMLGTIVSNGIVGPLLQKYGVTQGRPISMRSPDMINQPTAKYWFLWPGVVCMIAASFTDVAVNGKVIFGGVKDMVMGAVYKLLRKTYTSPNLQDEIEDPASSREQVPTWVWPLMPTILILIGLGWGIDYLSCPDMGNLEDSIRHSARTHNRNDDTRFHDGCRGHSNSWSYGYQSHWGDGEDRSISDGWNDSRSTQTPQSGPIEQPGRCDSRSASGTSHRRHARRLEDRSSPQRITQRTILGADFWKLSRNLPGHRLFPVIHQGVSLHYGPGPG